MTNKAAKILSDSFLSIIFFKADVVAVRPSVLNNQAKLVWLFGPTTQGSMDMAVKKPFCNYSGIIKELQDGDTLSGVYTLVSREIPSGTKNGTNQDFSLANTPVTGSEQVYVNGILQSNPDDYSITGTTITFVTAPASTDTLLVTYWK